VEQPEGLDGGAAPYGSPKYRFVPNIVELRSGAVLTLPRAQIAESWGMAARPQKITLGEMRESGMRRILVLIAATFAAATTPISALIGGR
jgi:hypothetical protein